MNGQALHIVDVHRQAGFDQDLTVQDLAHCDIGLTYAAYPHADIEIRRELALQDQQVAVFQEPCRRYVILATDLDRARSGADDPAGNLRSVVLVRPFADPESNSRALVAQIQRGGDAQTCVELE